MKIQVGAARVMGDGSGDASVSVTVGCSRKRQVRVVRGMDESYALFVVVPSGDLRLIHPAAVKDCPSTWEHLSVAPGELREILAKAREVMDNPKLQRGVLKAIAKRKERERVDRVRTRAAYVKDSIKAMYAHGATHQEVVDAVNAALVAAVHNS